MEMLLLKQLSEIKSYIENKELCLLFISSYDCGVCTAVEPRLTTILNKFSKTYGIQCKIDDVSAVSGEYMVFTVPTILLFFEGKEVFRSSRFIDFSGLERLLINF